MWYGITTALGMVIGCAITVYTLRIKTPKTSNLVDEAFADNMRVIGDDAHRQILDFITHDMKQHGSVVSTGSASIDEHGHLHLVHGFTDDMNLGDQVDEPLPIFDGRDTHLLQKQ